MTEATTDLHLRLSLRVRVPEGEHPTTARLRMFQELRTYLTDPEGSLLSDYGPDTWGGYDGPIVESVTLARVELPVDSSPTHHPTQDHRHV